MAAAAGPAAAGMPQPGEPVGPRQIGPNPATANLEGILRRSMATSERTLLYAATVGVLDAPIVQRLQTQFEQLKTMLASASDRNALSKCALPPPVEDLRCEAAKMGTQNFNDSDSEITTPHSPHKFKLAAFVDEELRAAFKDAASRELEIQCVGYVDTPEREGTASGLGGRGLGGEGRGGGRGPRE